ncbi:MAG: NAD-binding protein [bacterium]
MYIIIIGCSQLGAKVATFLAYEGNDIVIIDKNKNAFNKLDKEFNGITIIGDGFNESVLKEANIDNANIFIALTNNDNINIITSQIAKKIYHVPRVIAKISESNKEDFCKQSNIETIGISLIANLLKNKILQKGE